MTIRPIVYCAGILISALSFSVSSAVKNWACNDNTWDNPACWAPTTGQPISGDDVFLQQSDGIDRTVTYANTITPAPKLQSLTINSTGTGTMTLSQSQNALNVNSEIIGLDGAGVHTQSSGVNSVETLYLGYQKNGNGTYNLSETGSLIADREIISRLGNGTFNQSGGTNKANYIAVSACADFEDCDNKAGVYNLSNGSLTVNNLDIVNSTNGPFSIGKFNQSGGEVTVNNRLNLADMTGADGQYNLSSGNLTSGELGVWVEDATGVTGEFNQTGGIVNTNKVSSTFFSFNYNLDAGQLITNTIDLQANAQFRQTAGTNTITDSLILDIWRDGGQPDSGSQYTLTGGTLTAGKILLKGSKFIQTGGTNTTNYLAVSNCDFDLCGSSTYEISNGSLIVDNLDIASSSEDFGVTGVFNQKGGSVTVNERLNLADTRDASGTYNLSSGELNTGELGLWDTDAISISGVFNQTGGSVTTDKVVSTFDSFTYNLEAGNLNTKTIELQDWGQFNQTGGSNNISDTLTLDIYQAAGVAFDGSHYNLSDGRLSTGNIVVKGNSTFTQTGGTNTTRGNISLVVAALNNGGTGSGKYTLAGGRLEVNSITTARDNSFNFTGGTLSVDTFNGNLVNNGGTLSPGSSPGKTRVNGNYSQNANSSYKVEIGGFTQGKDYDWLEVSGNATLAGALDVSLLGQGRGFTLSEGDVFDILSAETINGEFDTFNLADLDSGLKWDIAYLADVTGTTDSVRLTVASTNQAPIANAGFDQFVDENNIVNLNGSGKDAEDGSVSIFEWKQTAGAAVTLSDANTATPSFIAPSTTSSLTLTFSLIVTDSAGLSSDEDIVTIEVLNNNGFPVANAGVDQKVNENDQVNLDGSASSDSDGDIEQYRWTQTSGTPVVINNPNNVKSSFTVPAVSGHTVLTFTLEVTDASGESDTDTVSITINNTLIADAGVDQQVSIGKTVSLNALNSLAINNPIKTYKWTQKQGFPVSLNDGSSAKPNFTTTSDMIELVFELVVTDSNGLQDSDTVLVNVHDQQTPMINPLDIQLLDTVAVAGTIYRFETQGDPFVNSSSIVWRQVSGEPVQLQTPDTKEPSFTTPDVSTDTTATFEVVTTNVDDITTRAQVVVNIQATGSNNRPPIAVAEVPDTVVEGTQAVLNASASSDDESEISEFIWQQIGGPFVLLDTINTKQAMFTAPVIATSDDGVELTFELRVVDDKGFVDRQSVSVQVLDNGITAFSDDVTAIISSSGKPIGIEPISDGELISLSAVNPNTIQNDNNQPESLPYGLLDYSIRVAPGATVNVNIALPSPAGSGFTWWKYSDANGWQDFSAHTSFNPIRDVIILTLTDNGPGDDDPRLGWIRDPGGLATASNISGGGTGSGSSGGGSIGLLLLMILVSIMSYRRYIYQVENNLYSVGIEE